MELPYSDDLDIKYLSRVFDNKSECYKLFWFEASECQDKDVKSMKRTLTRNVPYRLQAPFMESVKGKEWMCLNRNWQIKSIKRRD